MMNAAPLKEHRWLEGLVSVHYRRRAGASALDQQLA